MSDYSELKGKKLLILGCTPDEIQIVLTAKKLGLYTIVTDYNTDWSYSPAKYIADEAWDISWADINALKEKSSLAGVSGVMAGYSELRIQQAIKLCKELNFPFYVDDESILLKTFDKQLFKNICRENGVPVIKDYYSPDVPFDVWASKVNFPVLVKPVDDGGSRGIRCCYSIEDLKRNIDYALSFSKTERVLVEELIQNGKEVVIYYTIADGEIALSAMCDKYERVTSDGFNSLPDAYVYPSIHMKEYLEYHNDAVIRTLKSMGMKNGSANLQGFYTKEGTFVFFEMDFRPGGTNTYHFTDHFSGENYLRMLISYSITGKADKAELTKADPLFSGKIGCIFTLLSKNGIITHQEGKETVDSWPNVLYTCYYHPIGKKIEVNGSQAPKTFRAYIVGNNITEINEIIRKIQQTVKVYDENGNNMLFEPFDVNRLISPI